MASTVSSNHGAVHASSKHPSGTGSPPRKAAASGSAPGAVAAAPPVSRSGPAPASPHPPPPDPDLVLVDHDIFDQLLEMDEDDDEDEGAETHSFAKNMVLDYFQQAKQTFKKMDDSYDKRDLTSLSRLGHFLKGSSAALGLIQVKTSCEGIQNVGNMKTESGSGTLSSVDEALAIMRTLIKQSRRDYKHAENYLHRFFAEDLGIDLPLEP